MSRGPDRVNTVVLSVLGLVLAGVGAYGMARGYGALGENRATDAVLTNSVRDFVARNDDWFWPLAAAASVLTAWIGLRWLAAQLRHSSVSHISVRAEGAGRTELSASGAAAALARDVEAYPGVKAARARVTDDSPTPEIQLTVEVHDDADTAEVRRRIEEHALARFTTALEVPGVRPRVHLRLADRAPRSVR